MPKSRVSFQPPSTEIRKAGASVGTTDRIYQLGGRTVSFDEVLVKGDLSGELEYNGQRIRIVHVDTIIGLELTMQGARGPVWKKVRAEVLGPVH